MNNNFTKLMLAALLTGGSLGVSADDLIAFPDAAGWGRFAKGVRANLSSASVYHVTNLKDSGTGSLRDAISQPNRIIVFDVAGVINISSRLVFKNNLYVAGQTAPGEGVTVYGDGVSFSGANNIIVRYMRFRMGHGGSSGKDCAGIANGQNMIFDHCSFSWGLDETFSINPDNKGQHPDYITISNTIMGQGLMPHSAGGLMQSNYITLYRNLYCDNSTRNNKVKGINQFVNNVVYNWSNMAYNMGGDSSGDSYCNIEGNLFINGPSKGGNAFSGGSGEGAFNFYGNDNWQDSNMDGIFDPYEVTNYAAGTRQDTPYDYPELPKYAGNSLLETLIPTVGASLPYRDPSDCYMIDEVMSVGKKGALISNEETLPYGAPNTWSVWGGNSRVDTDDDGIPDVWETKLGTDPNKDDALELAANGYTNIENYVNSITVDDRDYYLRKPLCIEFVSATTSTIKLQWCDYTYGEDGFVIELRKAGTNVWKEMARTSANATSYTLTGLPDGTQYDVRLRAFADDKTSDYSEVVTMATRPVETGVIDIDSYEPDLTWDNTATAWDLTTKSWNGGQEAYTDGKKVLFNATEDATAMLTETVLPEAIVVKGNGNVTIDGTGFINGETSVNKGGEGTLTLKTENTYEGATVLHDGVIEFSSLKDGGQASAIGASTNFAQNWIFDGGVYKYTGASTSTDRAAQVKNETELNVANKSAVVTMNGTFEGSGDLAFNGEGQVKIGTTKFFSYTGATILRGGTVYLSTTDISKAGIGSSSKLVMAGGELKTKGETSGYETYSFPMEIKAGTVSQFSPNRCCYWNSTVTGSGTLQFNIPYLREYLKGNFKEFTGKLIANGVSTEKEGSLLLLNSNSVTLPNAIVELAGNARLAAWETNGASTIGGLSGAKTTYLSGSSKKTSGFSCTWTIGGANTDETFEGKINNWSAGGSGYKGNTKIIKTGKGYWRLTGTNDFSGGTVINGGNLIVNGTNSGTGNVTLNNVGSTLSGKGSVAGAVKVTNGTIIQAGDIEDEDYGTKLTLKGQLTVASGGIVSVQTDGTTCNTIVTTAPILEDGAVIQIGEGESDSSYALGKTYQVFSTGATLKGKVKIIPSAPYNGLVWDTSALSTEGVLKVADATGIQGISVADGLKNVQYFDVNGVRVSSPAAGATIVRGTDANGKVIVRKIMK